jgi:hypothetical protein
MKKKYFAPEIEEVKMDEPIVLQEQAASSEEVPTCPTQVGCGVEDV